MLKTVDMISKIYLGVLAVSIAAAMFFTYYAWSWLQSIGQPVAALDGYLYNSRIAMATVLVSAVMLMIIANAMMWLSQNSWAMWTTLGYFAVYMLVYYFWLEPAALAFKSTKGLAAGSFSIGPLYGVIFIIAAGIVVFLDQFLVVQLRRKTYPAPAEDIAETEAADV